MYVVDPLPRCLANALAIRLLSNPTGTSFIICLLFLLVKHYYAMITRKTFFLFSHYCTKFIIVTMRNKTVFFIGHYVYYALTITKKILFISLRCYYVMITSSAYMRRFTCGKKSLKNLKKHQRK